MSFLKTEQVSKTYKTGNHFHTGKVNALQNVSFEMEKGECLAVVGESGSGKSTLGRLIVGLEEPTCGRVLFKGKTVGSKRMDKAERQSLQMVYQNSFEATDPRFTAGQIIEEPLKYFHLLPKKERRNKAAELLKTVGIPETEMDKKAPEFSGGQLQRICIARALAASPELILLDEPLSSLDVSVQAQMLNLLQDLKESYNLTYLLISHDLEVVYNLADHLLIMYFGRVVEEISDMNLFEKMRHPYSLDLIDAAAYKQAHEKADDDALPAQGCIYAPRCRRACEKCRREMPELREIGPGHKLACHLGGVR